MIPPRQINPSISEEINNAVLWGMQLKPEARPQSVKDWLECLKPRTQPLSYQTGASHFGKSITQSNDIARVSDPLKKANVQNLDAPDQAPKTPKLIAPHLWQNTQLLQTITGHRESVNAVAFNPDGQTFVSASSDHTIKLWGLETVETLHTFSQHTEAVFCVAISADGKTLVSGDYDYKIKLWNLDTRELIKTLIGHAGQVLSVDISPDGKVLVSGSIDGTIKTWSLDTFKQIRTFGDRFSSDIINYSRQHINPLVISRDGQTIINGIFNSTVKVWCLKKGKTLRTIYQQTPSYWETYVNSVCLSPDQGIIASNSQEQIQVWDLYSGELRYNLTGHCGMVYCLAISPDGQTLASGCEDYTIKLWNLNTGELIYTLGDDQSEFRGDTSPVYSVAFSPDGQTLISGQRNGRIKIWRVTLNFVSSDTIPS